MNLNEKMLNAAEDGDLELIPTFIEKGADVNYCSGYWQRTVLHYCSLVHNEALIDFLIKNKANINAIDVDGNTPLHLTLKYGFFEPEESASRKKAVNCALTLLKAGADETVKGEFDNLACEKAAMWGYWELLQTMRFNVSERIFLNCAERCRSQDSIRTFKFLCDRIPIETINENGTTALHIAAREGIMPYIEILHEKGADINFLNSSGISPLFLAKKNNHLKVVEYLIKNGAK
jgi:ankyrin repeat protein